MTVIFHLLCFSLNYKISHIYYIFTFILSNMNKINIQIKLSKFSKIPDYVAFESLGLVESDLVSRKIEKMVS